MFLIEVRLFKSFFTNISLISTLQKSTLFLSEDNHYKTIGVPVGDSFELEILPNYSKVLRVNAYFLYMFVKECLISEVYIRNVVSHVEKRCSTGCLIFILEPPDQEILDYSWNEKLLKLIWTRIEVENAFSWLSTLGGAYSALGDYFQNCAEEAGRISLRQFRLSKMLGDDGLAARSRLYLALAYSQKGKLKQSRHMVRKIAEYGRESKDKRLVRMCQGVWAKLKYLRAVKNSLKIKNTNNFGNGDGNSYVISVV